MKYFLNITLITLLLCTELFSADYYVSTNGNDDNDGSDTDPWLTIQKAVSAINPGDYIYVMGGVYFENNTITLLNEDPGTSGYKNIFAYENDTVIFDFSSMTESSSNRGLQVYGNYWHLKGLIIQNAGDNGMAVGGDYNIIENCVFRKNHDTGLQISRKNSSLSDIADWPSNNVILNCESYDNSDSDHEDADGFAAKLTCGYGNIFQNCVSHHNIDDGWDLYTKTESGPIGPVTLINCIAHNNGTLTSGGTSGNGDKNGFKLGGEDIAVNHIVRRCVAFNNGKHGFTYNRNLGSIEISNCSAYNNAERNFSFDGGTHIFTNNLSINSSSNDKIIGTDKGGNVWDNDNTPLFEVTAADFITLTPGSNARPYDNGFLQLKTEDQLIDQGIVIAGINYEGTAPDIGAFETNSSYVTESHMLTVSVHDDIGGKVIVSPSKLIYESGSVITLTAVPDSFWVFNNWSGNIFSSDSSIEITINEDLIIEANFKTNKAILTVYSSGPGTINIDPLQKLYDKGSTVTLTAKPYENCSFAGWSGDTSTISNPITFTIDNNIDISGLFVYKPSDELTLQFEGDDICTANGSVDNKHSGFYGTGFFDFTNAIGANIEFSIYSKENTQCDLIVRYAMGKNEDRPMAVEVNGIIQIESVDFPYTGAFTTWETVSMNILLNEGNNSINFISLSSQGGVNFDEVHVLCSDTLISLGDCDGSSVIINEFYLITSVFPSESGTISSNKDKSFFAKDEEVELTAIPNEGYRFTGWTKGYIGTENPLTFNMDANYVINANFESVAGINQLSDKVYINIYPNPVSEKLIIHFSQNSFEKYTLRLFDISGKSQIISDFVSKEANNNISININNVNPGIYILEVSNKNIQEFKKIVVQ